MSASKETTKLLQLQQHVSSLKDQKNEVDKQKSQLLQKKDTAISDVSDKCMSLEKSIINLKTTAIRQLNEFYNKPEKLFDDVLANLETRIAKAEEELTIDFNGIPLPPVKAMSYDFDVTKAKTSIEQIELRPSISAPSPLPPPPPPPSPPPLPPPSGNTNSSTSKESETRETKGSTSMRSETAETSGSVSMDNQQRIKSLHSAVKKPIRARKKLKSVPQFHSVSTPKRPRLIEGQKREHVRDFIYCSMCKKPRCIYRGHFLTDAEKLALSKLKVSTRYVCGEMLPTDNCNMAKSLIVEQKISCLSNVSGHYFQPKLSNPPVCYICGYDAISPVSEEERLEYRALHKICASCQQRGGKPRGRRMARVKGIDDKSMDDSDLSSYIILD